MGVSEPTVRASVDQWARDEPFGGGPFDPHHSAPGLLRRAHRNRLRAWVVVVGTVVAVFILQATTLQSFTISSGSTSMEPTLLPGDRIVTVKVAFTLHRGDVVVLTPPPTATRDENHEDLVKRIIGMPGDSIWSVGNRIFVNGKRLVAPWISPGEILGRKIKHQVVPDGEYYLLGDNLSPSYDSRWWGPVPRSDIVAKVECIVWRDGPELHCL